VSVRVAIIVALAGCGGGSGNSDCGPSQAMVDRVIDGDTIVLTTGDKIRYLLINAPETTNGHNDCYGANATKFNSDMVSGKMVDLTYDVQCTDIYGRLLAYVSVDGQEVNTLMVERGFACVLHIPPDGDDRAQEFEDLQTEAKAANRGLWGACSPIPCN
jgi:micrococcal nuclease